MEWCYDLGIKAITVYAFSIENFNRSPEEVGTLMNLAIEKFDYMTEQSELVKKYDVRIRVIGELEMLPEDVRRAAERAMAMTKSNRGPIVNICFPYTAKAELITVCNKMLSEDHSLTLNGLEGKLYTAGSPPVDVMIRTSGEKRLSEFLNWQLCDSMCQIEFLDIYWPEFKFWHFLPILAKYQLDRLTSQPMLGSSF